MAKWIYFVGKPYPKAFDLKAFKTNRYKIGVLLDKNSPLRYKDKYDDVVEIDFSSDKSILEGLASHTVEIDGLVCTYENFILAKSQIAAALKLPASSIASAEMSTDKFLMRQAFLKSDPSITPRFGLAESQKEALGLAKNLSYPLIIKPTNLVKSLLVLRCNNQSELLRNFAYAQQMIEALYKKYKVYNRKPQLIIEEYIDGKTCSIAAFVDEEGEPHFCEGIVSLVNAQDINIDDNYLFGRFLPADFDEQLQTKLFKVARRGIKALRMTSTPAHVELIYNDQGIKLIEIGARIGGYRPRMYAMSYGLDLIEQEIKLALGQKPDVSGRFRAYSAVYELFPADEGAFAGIGGAADTSQFAYYKIKAKIGQLIGPAKSGYKAVAVVVVSSPDKEEFLRIGQSVAVLQVKIV